MQYLGDSELRVFIEDVLGNDLPFGGKVVIFSGDFRQNLPVIKFGNRADIVDNTIKKMEWWYSVRTLSLTDNMRVLLNGNTNVAREFTEMLLSIGDGRFVIQPEVGSDAIKVPNDLVWPDQNSTTS